MKTDLQIVMYAAWVIVAIAAAAPFILSRMQGDERLLGILRSRSRPILPIDRSELQDQIGAGIRVVLVLTVAALIVVAFLSGKDGWLAVIVYGGMAAPFLTIPMSVVHTVLIRFLGFRGPFVSLAAGVVVGTLASRITRDPDFTAPEVIFGGVYGLIVGLRHAMVTRRGTVPEEGTDTFEEPPEAPLF
jgi:hypothetical protein